MAASDDILRLQREAEESRRELNQLRLEINQTLEQEGRRMSALIQTEMRNVQADWQAQYESAAAELRQSYQTALDKLYEQYYELLARQETIEAELREAYENVNAEMQQIRQRDAERTRAQKQTCDRYFGRLSAVLKRLGQSAAEAFFPGKTGLGAANSREARQLYHRGEYSAAFAVLSSAELGARRLEIETAARLREVCYEIGRYRAAYCKAAEMLGSPCFHRAVGQDGTEQFRLSDTELDFWSDGTYSALVNELRTHWVLMQELDGNLKGWLSHSGELNPVRTLREKTDELQKLSEQLRIAAEYALSACACYQSMFALRAAADAVFHAQNFTFFETRFGSMRTGDLLTLRKITGNRVQKPVTPGEIADIREERQLIWHKPFSGDTVTLRLIPQRCTNTTDMTHRILLGVRSPHDPEKIIAALLRLLRAAGLPAESDCSEPVLRPVMTCAETEEILSRRRHDLTSGGIRIPEWATAGIM